MSRKAVTVGGAETGAGDKEVIGISWPPRRRGGEGSFRQQAEDGWERRHLREHRARTNATNATRGGGLLYPEHGSRPSRLSRGKGRETFLEKKRAREIV